jgi:hypothetical protein
MDTGRSLKHLLAYKLWCNYQAETIVMEFSYCEISKHTGGSTPWNILISNRDTMTKNAELLYELAFGKAEM